MKGNLHRTKDWCSSQFSNQRWINTETR